MCEPAAKHLKSKKYGLAISSEQRSAEQQQIIDDAKVIIDSIQLRFSYFMWRYLSMYVALFVDGEKIPNCTKFGMNSLDYKGKAGLERLYNWLDDPLKELKEKASQNASTEFYKGIFNAPKYGVSTRAPVRHVRYDGIFELYVNTSRELEAMIQARIEQSGRWYLRVGKLSVGRLSKLPERIPPQHWPSINDDVHTLG
ncbi:hypothetical protein CS022_22250 [Veronia nyctiphanis]|uniref:Uncharacterized protein n=2 Tax=Veronia nyctiphanis TaxID=1278244 RepID=A0A4Q0YNH2_9GAMM|nr:hypothetical protein CS022_22250 [Veronia nyctiphanis]